MKSDTGSAVPEIDLDRHAFGVGHKQLQKSRRPAPPARDRSEPACTQLLFQDAGVVAPEGDMVEAEPVPFAGIGHDNFSAPGARLVRGFHQMHHRHPPRSSQYPRNGKLGRAPSLSPIKLDIEIAGALQLRATDGDMLQQRKRPFLSFSR